MAFGQLSVKYYQMLYNYGVRIVTDTDLVRDCIQDLLRELWTRREHLTTTLFVKPYLLKAFRHKMIKESL